jgi:two-component system, cell cycle sensor histidine kinase and response regulator CckA
VSHRVNRATRRGPVPAAWVEAKRRTGPEFGFLARTLKHPSTMIDVPLVALVPSLLATGAASVALAATVCWMVRHRVLAPPAAAGPSVAGLERRGRLLERYESVGLLNSGLRHDVGNLLQIILAQTDLAIEDAPETTDLSSLRTIDAAAREAARLSRTVLSQTADDGGGRELTTVAQLCTDLFDLVRVPLSARAHLQLSIQDGGAVVNCDPVLIRRLLLNFVTNAADALTSPYGLVQITTSTLAVDGRWLRDLGATDPVQPGRYAVIEVTDEGAGMSDETQDRMFDAMFTTKAAGHGMGLASARKVAREHGGTVAVVSAEGEGTQMRLLLPIPGGNLN